MSNIRLSKDMIGNKVRCVNKIDIHHPEQGTIGTIVAYDEHDAICNYKVQWPKGSTVGNDRWWVINKCIELVKDDVTTSHKTTDMTNEEIWEMLKPKMEKNALTTQNIHTGSFWPIYTYNANDVHNAIAIAYRSGYERAMKGRPFKIGEKKKKGGHWVPVDPNNLPKEGTRVRYSRECEHYVSASEMIGLGDIGEFSYSRILNIPGIRFNDDRYWDWVSFFNSLECLDMWVEDEE